MNRYRHPDRPGCFAEEGAFAPVGLDEMDVHRPHGGEDEPREAGAAAEVDQRRRRIGTQGKQLRRIEHVPSPQIRQCRLADEVDPPVPFPQQLGVAPQSVECFT